LQPDRRAEIRRWIKESEDAQDNPLAAMELCQRAVRLAEEAGPGYELELADSLRQHGVLSSLLTDYETALSDYAQVYHVYETHNHQKGIAILQDLTSVVFAAVGLYPEALQGFLTSYEFFRASDDLFWKLQLLNNVGFSYLLLNDPGAGMPYLEECARVQRASGQLKDMGSTLDSLAHAFWRIGDIEQALAYSLESSEIALQQNSRFQLSECKRTAARIFLAKGDTAMALEYIQAALRVAKEAGFRRLEAEALFTLGETQIQLEQYEPALQAVKRALALAQDAGLRPLVYDCFRLLGEICKRRGDFEGALNFYEQLIDVAEETSRYQARMRLRNLENTREIERTRRENYLVREKNSALLEEIEKRKLAQSLAEQLAITDSLTGMFNRRHFFDLARQELARALRYGHPLTLIMLDIDHFKQVNDTYGHIAGDDVLVMQASLIRASLREGDLVGRYGGEEFVILLPDTDLEHARQAAERLREAIAVQNLETARGVISVTISIGIASTSHAQTGADLSLDQMLSWADDALYHAKRAGRNRIAVYQPARK